MNLNNAYGADNILDYQTIGATIPGKFNGRVDLIGEENPQARMQMMEKVTVKNKAVTYCDSIKGQWEDNVTAQVFFSKDNIQIIQNAIREGVYQLSREKYIIPPPNMDNLMVIMRSYFLGYVQYGQNVTQEVETLNSLVVDYCTKELFSASKSYVQYVQDQSSMYMPLKVPMQNDRNYKQLQLKDWVWVMGWVNK